jgi:hypothetical protein
MVFSAWDEIELRIVKSITLNLPPIGSIYLERESARDNKLLLLGVG